MSTTLSLPQWRRRPGIFAARMFCLGLAMLTVLAGFILYAASDFNQLFWLLGLILLAMWLGLQGGPLLLRLLEKGGFFGRVEVIDKRLELGRGSDDINLTRPMEVETRFQHSTITRRYNIQSAFGSSGRFSSGHEVVSKLGVNMMSMAIEQDGRRFYLTADETSRRPGREYSLEGLNIRRVAIGLPKGIRAIRLWPADLAEILSLLQETEVYSTALSPVPDKALEDPRRAVCPIWKMVIGVTAILLTVALLATGAFNYYTARQRQRIVDMEAAALAEGHQREAEAKTLIGRRVMIPVSEKVRMSGRVTRVELVKNVNYYPEYNIEWRVQLTVEIDNLDHSGSGSGSEGAVAFRHADDLVRVGSLVKVYRNEVQQLEAEATPPAARPAGSSDPVNNKND